MTSILTNVHLQCFFVLWGLALPWNYQMFFSQWIILCKNLLKMHYWIGFVRLEKTGWRDLTTGLWDGPCCKLTFWTSHTHTSSPHPPLLQRCTHLRIYMVLIWTTIIQFYTCVQYYLKCLQVRLVQVFYFRIRKTKGNKVFKSLGRTGTQKNVVSGPTSKKYKFMNANYHY